jgi:hypothetical protein
MRGRRFLLGALLALAGLGAQAQATGIERSHFTARTKADPYLSRGSYTLTVRGKDVIVRWTGTVRRATHLTFFTIPSTKPGGSGPPGFHGEPPERSLVRAARKGHGRTVRAVFRHPKVLNGWPCVQGNVNDTPPGAARVYPLGPMAFYVVCPRGGFRP